MPLCLFYTMVQNNQKWRKTQIKGGGGGPALTFSKVQGLEELNCKYMFIP